MNRKLFLIAGCLVVLAGCTVTATPEIKPPQSQADEVALRDKPTPPDPQAPWPMFGGTPSRNMVNLTDKNIPITWSVEEGKHKNIKWSAELGNYSYGGPVVADGKVFIGTNNHKPRDKKVKGQKAILMAFNESDGKFLWQIVHHYPDDPTFHEALSQGLCSTPVVEGKRLYYVTPTCQVICADTAGNVQWTYDMMKELKVVPFHVGNCSPLIVGDLVMVVTGNGVDTEGKVVSPKAPSFIAVNKKTGKLAWQSSLPGARIIEGQWSNPTLATVNGKTQVIFPGGDCVLYSLEPETGNLIWKCDCNPVRKKKGDRGIDTYIVATPVVVGNRVYIGLGAYPEQAEAAASSYFLCLDTTKKGDVSFKTYDVKDAANKNSALVWAFGGPILPPPERGRGNYFGKTISTAAIHDGLIYIAEEAGYLHVLDAKTGQRYYQHDFKENIWGSAYYVDGKVYLGTEGGDIFIFEPGKQLRYFSEGKVHAGPNEKGEIKAAASMDGTVHSTPVVANGVLYITTREKLYAIAHGK